MITRIEESSAVEVQSEGQDYDDDADVDLPPSFPKILLADPTGHLQSHQIDPNQAKQIEDAFKAFESEVCHSAAHGKCEEKSDSMIILGDRSGSRLNSHQMSVSQAKLVEDAFENLEDEIKKFASSQQLPVPKPRPQSKLLPRSARTSSNIAAMPVLEDQSDESQASPMILLADRSGHLQRHYLMEGQAKQIDDAFKSFQTEIRKCSTESSTNTHTPSPPYAREKRNSLQFSNSKGADRPRRLSLGNDAPDTTPFKLIDYSRTKAKANSRNNNPCYTREELKLLNAGALAIDNNNSGHSHQSAPCDIRGYRESPFPFIKQRRSSLRLSTSTTYEGKNFHVRQLDFAAAPPVPVVACQPKEINAATEKQPLSSCSVHDISRSQQSLAGRPPLRRNYSDSHRVYSPPMIDPNLLHNKSELDPIQFQVRRRSLNTRQSLGRSNSKASYNQLRHSLHSASSCSRGRGRSLTRDRQRPSSSLDVQRNDPLRPTTKNTRSHSLRPRMAAGPVVAPPPPYLAPNAPPSEALLATATHDRRIHSGCSRLNASDSELDFSYRGRSLSVRRRSMVAQGAAVPPPVALVPPWGVQAVAAPESPLSAYNSKMEMSDNELDTSRRGSSKRRSQSRRRSLMMKESQKGSWRNLMNNSDRDSTMDDSGSSHHFITGSRIRRHTIKNP